MAHYMLDKDKNGNYYTRPLNEREKRKYARLDKRINRRNERIENKQKRKERKKINMKYKTKNTLKTILLSALGIGAIVGSASLINNVVNKADDEGLVEVHPMFSIGGLNDEGKYEEATNTIYTKEAFECLGLSIKLDFEDTIDYEVFFYDNDGNFISSSGVQESNSKPSIPLGATHARIEITPDWEALDITKEKDQEIKWYEVSKYSKQMEIKVDEEQGEYVLGDFTQVSLTNSKFVANTGKIFTTSGTLSASTDYNTYSFTASEKCSFYMMNEGVSNAQYIVAKNDGTFIRYQIANGTWLGGEENVFALEVGESVHISVGTADDLSKCCFYLATYILD